MNTIGIIGGMSWHSTLDYYRVINAAVADELGGHHSAPILVHSVDFAEIRDCQVTGNWERAGDLLAGAAEGLVGAGADAVLIATNLMHKVAPAVEARVDVPLLHIADAVAQTALSQGLTSLGVIGSKWVMEEDFYADRLARHGVSAVRPCEGDQVMCDRVVFGELTQGVISEKSREQYVDMVGRLRDAGADGVVMACTEIQLLLQPEHSPLPLVDSMHAHASYAADFVLDRVGVSA